MATKGSLALPAQVDCASRPLARVLIAELTELHCLLEEDLPPAEHVQVQLWLGGIGPLQARRSSASDHELEFDGPINVAIVQHFMS